MRDEPAFDLTSTYLDLGGDGAVTRMAGGAAFWQQTGAQLDAACSGYLVLQFRCERDMQHQEMHPLGDEVLHLVSGAVDVVLALPDGERVIALRAGRTCVVPKGTWHHFVVREPGTMLGMTFGRGTQHRPR